jgi:hypothetical protein
LNKTKSIDELYSELSEHDRVLTADAALADALNRRLDRPVEGVFASTPGRLAGRGEETDSRREVFLKAVEETDYSWKQISHAIEKIFGAWKHTGERDAILTYERYESDLYRDILEVVNSCRTSFHAVEELNLDGDVAVVNYFQFNELDKTVLPDNFEKYSIFSEEEAELENFNIFESGLDLVNSLMDNINEIGAENAGVVVRPDSRYQKLIESYFKHSEINFVRRENVSESENLRIYISLLEAGLTDRRLRVRDLNSFSDIFEIEEGNQNLFVENSDSEIKEFINILNYMEFSEALDELENITGENLDEIRDLLEDLGLESDDIDAGKVEKLRYYIENFDESLEESNEGVLLADPDNSSVIDRPVVFLLGMSNEWNERTGEDPWIDEEWIEEKNRREFEIIAQSGDSTVYMVQDKESGEDIKPSFHLDEITGEEVEGFRDLEHSFRSAEIQSRPSSFQKDDVEKEYIDSLSQSDLNNLAKSPRLFYMSKLISEAEEEHLKKGQLFHEFAELYYNYPEKADDNMEEIIEIFTEEMQKIVDEESMLELRTEISEGLKKLRKLLKTEEEYSGQGYIDTDDGNFLAEELNLEISSDSTEMYFNEEGMKGKVDLIAGTNHLIDFKSGKKKSRKEIVKASRPQTFEDERYPDFQPLMYIAHHSNYVNGEIKFSFLYFLDNLGSRLGNGEEEDPVVTVEYTDSNFESELQSHELFEFLIRDVKKSNKRRKTLEKLGFSKFAEFFSEREFPEIFDKEEVTESDLADEFVEMCVEQVGDYKYVRRGARSALKKIVEYRNTRYFREDIEEIEKFVQNKLEEIENYEDGGYPVGEEKVSELSKEELIV